MCPLSPSPCSPGLAKIPWYQLKYSKVSSWTNNVVILIEMCYIIIDNDEFVSRDDILLLQRMDISAVSHCVSIALIMLIQGF